MVFAGWLEVQLTQVASDARAASGEQQFDPDRGVAGGHHEVEGYPCGVASLG
jgi:hypothetical protein